MPQALNGMFRHQTTDLIGPTTATNWTNQFFQCENHRFSVFSSQITGSNPYLYLFLFVQGFQNALNCSFSIQLYHLRQPFIYGEVTMASYILDRLRRVGSGLFVSNSPALPPENEDVTRSPAPQEEPAISSSSQDEAVDRSMSPQKEAVAGLPSPQGAIAKTPSRQEKAIARSTSREDEAVVRSPSLQEEPEDLFVSQGEAVARSSSPRQEATTRTPSFQEEAVSSPSPVAA